MLARSFKTAEDLGLSEKERDALIKVLGMLERGDLVHINTGRSKFPMSDVPNGFNMAHIGHRTECGTIGCMAGWARFVSDDYLLFQHCWVGDFARASPTADALRMLFLFGTRDSAMTLKSVHMRSSDVTPEQAAHALSNYLTTGAADWAGVLSA